MPYEYTTDKRGNRRFARVATSRVVAKPKGKVTIEPAQPATVAKVDIDSGDVVAVEPVKAAVEVAAVSVPTTPKPKKKS
jgi:hypothetical protein